MSSLSHQLAFPARIWVTDQSTISIFEKLSGIIFALCRMKNACYAGSPMLHCVGLGNCPCAALHFERGHRLPQPARVSGKSGSKLEPLPMFGGVFSQGPCSMLLAKLHPLYTVDLSLCLKTLFFFLPLVAA